ncbi:hypothetical protein [Bradyrhizobium lablabi]|uniref:hypothetical protein n=1 Tax=Bradyrhizobium lablabi TaxID=722472 RepID=UPI001BA9EABB|nr:hypothetical protein [Bradyrhizobium lablabi]MBR0692060.1 hypothetical protein [Bradyrhizobium lablabi]
MNENELIIATENLRMDPHYHAAEIVRRRLGAQAMATSSNEDDKAAVQLLIGTWETIAALTRGVKGRDRVFERMPVCHMYQALAPAIEVFRATLPEYAAGFEKLNTEYHAWMKKKKKSAEYVTSACSGMLSARFG